MYVMRENKIDFKLILIIQLIQDMKNILLLLNIIKLIQDIVYLIVCIFLDFLYIIQLFV